MTLEELHEELHLHLMECGEWQRTMQSNLESLTDFIKGLGDGENMSERQAVALERIAKLLER